jgi:CMP-N-acetylneuraminic acid synthetase
MKRLLKSLRILGRKFHFLRPPELAKDDFSTLSVLQHAVRFLGRKEGCHSDIIVTLQPTSPLRKAEHIDEAVRKLIDTDANSVVSLCEVEAKYSPYWMRRIDEGKVISLIEDRKYTTRGKCYQKSTA